MMLPNKRRRKPYHRRQPDMLEAIRDMFSQTTREDHAARSIGRARIMRRVPNLVFASIRSASLAFGMGQVTGDVANH